LEAVTAATYSAGDGGGLERLREAAASFVVDPASGRSAGVAGGAWLVAYKFSFDQNDLARAIQHLEVAQQLEPTPARATNLASALLELADSGQVLTAERLVGLHARAVGLLTDALAATDESDRRWVTRATTMVGAMLDAVTYRLAGADVTATLSWARRLVRVSDTFGDSGGEPQNLLGCTLLAAADQGHPDGDLDEALDALRASLARTPPGHLDLPARRANLASILVDRYERSGGRGDLDEAIGLHREALGALATGDPRRRLCVNNVVNALLGRYRELGDPSDLDEAGAHLPELIGSFEPGDPRFAATRSNAGLVAHELAVAGDDPEALGLAVALHTEAVAATAEDDWAWPGRASSLSVSLTVQYQRTAEADVLRRALELSTVAARHGRTGAAHEWAIFESNLGNLHHEVFLRTGRIQQLELAARHHRDALAGLPDRYPTLPVLLNNAAIVLNDRYLRLGDPEDLTAATAAIERSLDLTPAGNPTRPARLNNSALMLNTVFGITGDVSVSVLAARRAELGADLARSAGDVTTESTCYSTLADILGTRLRELPDGDAKQSLAQLWQGHRPELLRSTPASKPGRLLRMALHDPTVRGERRQELLRAVAETGMDLRPAVSLSAAHQLAVDGLALQVTSKGGAGRELVAQASSLAAAALDRLADADQPLRHSLSWYGMAPGIGAVIAQSRLLAGDTAGALAAYEDGHGSLLRSRVAAPVALDDWSVSLWVTSVGGGAVVRDPDGAVVPIELPHLTAEIVGAWVRRLSVAARLGPSALDAVLGQVVPRFESLAVAPVTRHLPPGVPVVWCAGGVAAMLPVAAARASDGEPLVVRQVLRQAPTPTLASSLASKAALREGTTGGPWWTVAAPLPSKFAALPGAHIEASAFAPEQQRLIGSAATVQAVRDVMTDAGLVHFACHARVTASDPLTNHLLLAGDEPLFADDIARLACPARTVVLSACDTAAVGSAHADQALGLVGAFLATGVPSVVASLWSVGDASTGRLMARFGMLLREGHGPVDALHLARIDHRRAGETMASWAAFSAFGA
jgi:tetratricopeptide (TPR) repeat protein